MEELCGVDVLAADMASKQSLFREPVQATARIGRAGPTARTADNFSYARCFSNQGLRESHLGRTVGPRRCGGIMSTFGQSHPLHGHRHARMGGGVVAELSVVVLSPAT